MLRRTLGENIEIVIIDVPRLPCNVKADSSQMEQAVDPEPGDPCARFHAARRTSAHICLTKIQRANGPVRAAGIYRLRKRPRRKYRATASFEPYFSINNPAKFGGLGLSAVYGIVQQNQGEIEVSSPLAQGSTFRIFLPLADGAGVQSPESEAPQNNSPKGTETSPARRVMKKGFVILVSAMLRSQGYQVHAEAEYGCACAGSLSPRTAMKFNCC